MRLILLGLASLAASCAAAEAAEPLPLGKHTVACRAYQDILDLKAASGQGEDGDRQPAVSGSLVGKYLDGTCQEYTAGTLVYTDREVSAGRSTFACIRTGPKDKCLWALKE